jgi:hypothetical protein
MSLKLNLSLTLPSIDNPVQTSDTAHRRNCRQLSDVFKKLASGNMIGVAGSSVLDFRTSGVSAAADISLVNGATSLASVIGGTTVTTTYSAIGGAGQSVQHDNETLTTHASDINANTTVNKWVTASVVGVAAAAEYVTLTSCTTGTVIVTVNGVAVQVTHDTDDDTDGAALVVAFNKSTASQSCTAAYNASNNRLTITAKAAGSAGNAITLACSGTGKGSSAAHGATLAGGTDKVTVTCKIPGVIGNSVSLSTGSTGATASAARLAGGSESRVTYSL